jgi:NADH pyrophosphatase NudC (nudix superfamily)
MEIIIKAAWVLIQDRQLLVTKSFGKDIYIAPWGKPNPWESIEQTLIRELNEELQIEVQESDLSHFWNFEAKAAWQENKIVQMQTFIVNHRTWDISPSNEVESILRTTSNISPNVEIWSIFAHNVIPELKKRNLID